MSPSRSNQENSVLNFEAVYNAISFCTTENRYKKKKRDEQSTPETKLWFKVNLTE